MDNYEKAVALRQGKNIIPGRLFLLGHDKLITAAAEYFKKIGAMQ